MSWILSSTCSGPWDTLSSASSAFSQAQEWIAYSLFSPCPQHSIIAIINFTFLASSAILNLGFSHSGTSPRRSISGWRFFLTLTSAVAIAAASAGITVFQAWEGFKYGWSERSIRETIFVAIEASAWITSIIILINERRHCIFTHPLPLRSWWFVSFLLSILQLMSSIFRLSAASGLSYDLLLEVFDIYALAKFPVACFLLFITAHGATGIHIAASFDDKLNEPLLDHGVKGHATISISTSGFAKASIFSKATFTWLTPLLLAGSKQSLEVGDVPMLAPRDRAESMYDLFQSKWPQKPGHLHPMRATLIKCFWPQLLLTGFLQLIRTMVLYAGPLLISSFTSYVSGDRASQYDGYVLVILLLAAKMVEVFSYHQYNFHCYRLGNNIRTAVVTTLYRKGLRLSSSARQDHGIGQITNYMVVDAQQLSDACLQLHLCWCLPLQVTIALVLLFQVIGISALAGLATMVVIAGITLYNSERQKFFQGNVMRMRDTRMKSVTEALAYMKVIKLQAWEEKFQEKVEGYRQSEFNWLCKFVIVTAVNMFTLWNTMPFVSVFTYVTAILLNAGLTTSKVFTAASIFRIVQEPIRNFPQAVIAFSQLVVSLERLDKYMLSSELEQGAVTKIVEVSEYPVVVHKGYFAWEDTQKTPILSDINLNIRRASLVTIVGTVGSGKSSLLGALLGEMVKISGTHSKWASLSLANITSDSFSDSRVPEGSSKLIEEEQRETGQVSWRVYWLYLTKAFGWATVAVLFLNQCLWQASLLASDYWLAEEIPEDSSQTINKSRFILVYVLLNAAAWIGILVRVIVVAAFGLKTAQLFFLDMLRSIFHAPMSFFDTTPSGRVLSRFSADQTNLDFILHFFVGGCLSTYFSALGVIIVISISTWPIVFLILPLTWLYYWYQNFYITSSREITRLDSITKAPLIYHFSETVAGIETIRCFRKQESFSQQNLDRVNMNMKMDFHNNTANEWLGLRLESIGTAILCTTAFLVVVLPENLIKSETVGLALSYALGLNASLYWTVWLTCTIENKMVSVERIRQFTTIPTEAVLSIPNCLPSPNWPTTGQIVSSRLKLRYRPVTPLVLKGVNFTIEGGQKVGVVGRTGSGKSTLILALFRLVEPSGGQILIDKVDIATIGLHDLRGRLGIIPQDPVLFEGTIRMNLDPLGLYSDEEIWRGLEKCQLAHIIREKPEKLEASVTEYGGNWSVGQRQLLCFGRALLKHSRILFLDEATASVDAQTDATIQGIIREEFKESTVMSIAHRIPTVMDSDKVLVMEAGRVKEFDSPSNLLHDSTSVFSSLVHEYSTRAGH